MSGFESVEEELNTHVGRFDPDGRGDINDYFAGLPDLVRAFSSALDAGAEQMGEHHIHPQAIEAVRELAKVIGGCADTAEDAFRTHLAEHKDWIGD